MAKSNKVAKSNKKLYIVDVGVRCLFNSDCPSVVAANKLEAVKYINGKYHLTRRFIDAHLISYTIEEVQAMIDTLASRLGKS